MDIRGSRAAALGLLGWICLLSMAAGALADSNRLADGELFFDDPGVAPGTGLPLEVDIVAPAIGGELLDWVPLDTLTPGLHTLYLRYRDSDGNWSPPVGRSFVLPAGMTDSGPGPNRVGAAEVFFDTDPGVGQGIPIDAPADGAFDQALEEIDALVALAGLGPGLHTAFVRVRDKGVWAPAYGQLFLLPTGCGEGTPSGVGNRVQAAEVFFDADPGIGQGIPLDAPADGAFDQALEEIDALVLLADLLPGVHTLYVRVRDNCVWAPAYGQPFVLPPGSGEGTPSGAGNRLQAAELFFDLDPGEGNGMVLAVVDGNIDEIEEQVDQAAAVADLEPGIHTAHVRFLDLVGVWSPVYRHVFEITDDQDPGSTWDQDWDGLPDVWELPWFDDLDQTGGGNPDLDAFDNRAEYELGLDPTLFDGIDQSLIGRVQDAQGTGVPQVAICLQRQGHQSCDIRSVAGGRFALGQRGDFLPRSYRVSARYTPETGPFGFQPLSADLFFGRLPEEGLIFTREPLSLTATAPAETTTRFPGETVPVEWSTNLHPLEPLILDIKRDSATLETPDGVDWYRFTDTAANDGAEPLTLPTGVADAADWRFVVAHGDSGLQASSPTFPIRSRPTADAGEDQTVHERSAVVLDGSASSDPNPNDTLTYAWTQTCGPEVTLSGADQPQAGFTAPEVTYRGADLCFQLTVTDPGGLSHSDTTSVRITGDPDTTGPELSDFRFNGAPLTDGTEITGSGAVSLMAADIAGISRVEFLADGDLFATDYEGPSDFSGLWQVLDCAGGVSEGSHTLTLVGYDTFGNSTTAGVNVTVMLGSPPAPEITAPASGLLTNTAEIQVKGTAEQCSRVQLQLNGSAVGDAIALGSDSAFTSQVTLAEGQNSLQARAENRGGPGPWSEPLILTQDSTVPNAPTGLYAEPRAGGQVRLIWNRPYDNRVVGVDLYRSRAPFETVGTAEKVNDELLTAAAYDDLPGADGLYYYRLVARNALGTASAPSNQASALADSVPPRALSVEFLPEGNLDPDTGRTAPGLVQVTVELSESPLYTPFFSLTQDEGSPIPVDLARETETRYRGTFEILESTPSGPAFVVFSARDKAGNRGTEVDAGGQILFDTDGPKVTALTTDPADPIRNHQAAPVAVAIALTLDAPLPDGGRPDLAYMLSGEGREATALTPTSDDGQHWQASLTLPADVGLDAVEGLTFEFSADDDLGNSGAGIEGQQPIQVYQGDLPPLAIPRGLSAEARPAGEIFLSWMPVDDAAAYDLYRMASGESELTPIQRIADATAYGDVTQVDGLHGYAIASVRQANGQEAISALSEPVSAVADSVAPEAPGDCALELIGAGIRAAWSVPAGESEPTYALYRADAEIIAVDGLAPILDGIGEPAAIDGEPDPAQAWYAVIARDPAGNESPPSVSRFLDLDLLPVTSLSLTRTEDASPLIAWTQTGDDIAGANLYLHHNSDWVRLNQTPLPGPDYEDVGYSGGTRRYEVASVNTENRESERRAITLPDLTADLVGGAPLRRGLMNRLRYRVANASDEALTGVRLLAAIDEHTHSSDSFALGAGETRNVDLVFGGHSDLPDLANLTTTIEIVPETGERVRIERTAEIEILDGALTIDLLTEGFVRGGSGRAAFVFTNTTDVEIDLIVATGFGAQPSNELVFKLLDADGNLLALAPLHPGSGAGLILLEDGRAIARIPPGHQYESDAVSLPVPLSAPDEVSVRLEVAKVHHRLGEANQVSIDGTPTSRTLVLADTAYRCEVQQISPVTSVGDEPITISGRAIARDSGQAMPLVPVRLVIQRDGFERSYDLYTDEEGAYSLDFSPLANESGSFRVSCIHPELSERPDHGRFTVSRVLIEPTSIQLRMARDRSQELSVQVTAPRVGTGLTSLRLVYDPQYQPDGVSPAGISVELPDPVDLEAGRTAALAFGVRADSTADDEGSSVLVLKSDEGGESVLGNVRVDYSLGAEVPGLFHTPSFLETGVAPGASVTETITLSNQGLAEVEGVGVRLLKPDDSPAPDWIAIRSAVNLGDLAIGARRTVDIEVFPGDDVPEGLYELVLRVESANHVPVDVKLYFTVSQSGIGSVLFHVSDIYTATLNSAGETIQGLEGARVQLQHELDASVEHELTTDSQGAALFSDLPAGSYRFRTTAADHHSAIGRVTVKPGVTVSREVFLDYDLVSIEWSVTEIPLEDRYEITLTATFETDVPAAVVVVEPPSVTLPDMQKGDVYHGELALTNYGLIRAEAVWASLPESNGSFQFDLLGEIPASLGAKQRVTIPYRVIALKALGTASDGAATGGGCSDPFLQALFHYAFSCANGDISGGSAPHNIYPPYNDCGGSPPDVGGVAGGSFDLGGGSECDSRCYQHGFPSSGAGGAYDWNYCIKECWLVWWCTQIGLCGLPAGSGSGGFGDGGGGGGSGGAGGFGGTGASGGHAWPKISPSSSSWGPTPCPPDCVGDCCKVGSDVDGSGG